MAAMDAARTTGPTYTRELLSKHETIAIYRGVELGNEHLLRVFPPRERKQWARFDIEAYVSFDKPGKYGDEKQELYRKLQLKFQVRDNCLLKLEETREQCL